jgi:hypothetical protein
VGRGDATLPSNLWSKSEDEWGWNILNRLAFCKSSYRAADVHHGELETFTRLEEVVCDEEIDNIPLSGNEDDEEWTEISAKRVSTRDENATDEWMSYLLSDSHRSADANPGQATRASTLHDKYSRRYQAPSLHFQKTIWRVFPTYMHVLSAM